MALQKPDGGTRPILCGEVWRRCFASLAVNATPIRNEAAKLFTSSESAVCMCEQVAYGRGGYRLVTRSKSQVYLQQNKKKARAEGNSCHA
jgi:hypothetical protein